MAFFLLLLACAGYTKWWVVLVNRAHALPVDPSWLRLLRLAYNLAIVGFPLFLVWNIGIPDAAALSSLSLQQLPPTHLAILIATASGCVPLVVDLVRWQVVQKQEYLEATESRRLNVTDELLRWESNRAAGQQPGVADGRSLRSALRGPRTTKADWFPWSEHLQLELNTKSISVGRLRAVDAPPLRIVHISDLHIIGSPGEPFYRFAVEQILELAPDAVILSGDLLDDMRLLPQVIRVLAALPATAPCYFVLGNHDWRYDAEQIRSALQSTGWMSLGSTWLCVTIAERPVYLAGTERPWLGTRPLLPAILPDELRLLVSHSPDELPYAIAGGFDVMLAGHTHGGQVVLPVLGPIFAPSRFGTRYAAGMFRRGELTLHVSRGLGGKQPLRWNCCPEVTLLEIS